VKAVNLIPRDARRGGVSPSSLGKLGASHLLIGLLVVAVAMVSLYVLTNNTVSSRKAQLSNLHAQISRVQTAVTRLQSYEKFEKLAQARESTVEEIAQSRFDWHGALSDLSKVVPANTTLESLVGTVVPGANATGGGAGGSGSLRTDLPGPAFELTGCTANQDDVARLMSELRLINGVTRVTFSNSQEGANASGSGTSNSGTQTCASNAATFDLVVFFQPVANAGAAGVTSVSSTPTTTSTSGTGGVQ
jgi:Tfp pilus assembly protein PilN